MLNALAFLFYGYNCIWSDHMVSEFNRFKLTTKQRKITGIAQLIGASGLLVGLWYYPLGLISSFGLTVLMLLGFMIRLRIKDSFAQSSPSFILMLLNAYFVFVFARQVFI